MTIPLAMEEIQIHHLTTTAAVVAPAMITPMDKPEGTTHLEALEISTAALATMTRTGAREIPLEV